MGTGVLPDAYVRILSAAQARGATRAERAWLHWMAQRYWRRTCRLLARVLDDPADTDAFAEEAFARAWQAATAVRSPLALEPRLLQLTIEIAESHRSARQRGARRGVHVVPEERLDSGSEPEGGRRASPNETLERSISELPWSQRTAVVLRDVEGLAGDVAAEVMNVEPQVFREHLNRGRMALVAGLAKGAGPSAQDEVSPATARGASPIVR